MSTGKGIHLNGDKAWLEQLLNEKFGRIEDRLETFAKQIEVNRLSIEEIMTNETKCKDEMQKQIYLLLGKEQGMNTIHKTDMEKKEYSIKKLMVGFSAITILLNIIFFLFRNWYFYK